MNEWMNERRKEKELTRPNLNFWTQAISTNMLNVNILTVSISVLWSFFSVFSLKKFQAKFHFCSSISLQALFNNFIRFSLENRYCCFLAAVAVAFNLWYNWQNLTSLFSFSLFLPHPCALFPSCICLFVSVFVFLSLFSFQWMFGECCIVVGAHWTTMENKSGLLP